MNEPTPEQVEKIVEAIKDQDNPVKWKPSLCMRLKPGFEWNPLLKIPRNAPCPCDSGKKFKHCHLVNMPRAVPEAFAKEYRAGMKQVDLLRFVEEAKPEDTKSGSAT